ncbi:MAG: Na/Pi cotransporter family protein [Planctomycetaceae bacterium]|nr:Na/Pi cotransporter family protein [Planctomycetaceae bacterium]
MTYGICLEMFSCVVGGLGIFLFGMKNMSEGLQAISGDRLRRMIGAVTDNRLMGVGVGAGVTATIQSSSATTVMLVSMVNAGLMTLKQAIPVIFGANIGTTLTAWIMAYSLTKYGLPILGMAAFFYLFTKGDRVRFTAMIIMGIGMIFFGMELMTKGLAPIRGMPEFEAAFQRFTADNYFGVIKCVLVGALVTAIVQASAATIGMTMALANVGLIGFPTAAALVLGENIGTTVTAFFASFGTTTNAKRSAYAHMLFNTIGVLWITPLFFVYTPFIIWFVKTFLGGDAPDVPVMINGEQTFPHAQRAIAATHSWFNIANVLVFLPWVGPYSRFLIWLLPEKAKREKPKLTFLDMRLFDAPAIGIQQSYKELVRTSHICRNMLRNFKPFMTNAEPNRKIAEDIFQKENDLDVIQKEIVEFIGEILTGNIPHDLMQNANGQIRIADELESISDYIQGLMKLRLKMQENNQRFSPKGLEDINRLHDKVDEYLGLINEALEREDSSPEYFSEMQTKGLAVTTLMKECRGNHLQRVSDGIVNPIMSLTYTDMLTAYRRIKDHAFNIAEVLVGEK